MLSWKMAKCVYCEENVGSYGWDSEGKIKCISCENLQHKYNENRFGTPNRFTIGQKVYVEYCDEWFKARIYTIEINKTPKGEITHYLCYYEHNDCYDEDKEIVESFDWFEEVKEREEQAELIDKDEYVLFENIKPRDFGNISIKTMPDKLLKEDNKTEQIELCKFM